VPQAYAELNSGFEIEILGERCKATRLPGPVFDPEGGRMRG